VDYDFIEKNIIRTSDENIVPKMLNLLENIKKDGNSIGGIVECHIKNVPV
jgi:chorismate synthase